MANEAKSSQRQGPETVTFEFEVDEGYRIVPANGVWGGPTPRGDIRADFVYEFQAMPAKMTYAVDANGKMGKEVSRTPSPGPILRRAMFGVMLTSTQARSIGKWLIDKADEVDRLTSGGTQGEGK